VGIHATRRFDAAPSGHLHGHESRWGAPGLVACLRGRCADGDVDIGNDQSSDHDPHCEQDPRNGSHRSPFRLSTPASYVLISTILRRVSAGVKLAAVLGEVRYPAGLAAVAGL
jgi:hypothetical protein